MYALRGIYPRVEGAIFDFDYYQSHHMPLCMKHFGANARSFEVAKSLPGEKYICIGTIYLESVQKFEEAFAVHGAEIAGDVKNYTNVQAIIEMQEIL